jgi:FG-GAP-like repeat
MTRFPCCRFSCFALILCLGLSACGGSSSNGANGGQPITPATITMSSVTFAPNSVVSGTISTGTVTAATPAPTGGVVISLSSGNAAAASVPTSVTIPAGNTSATFSVSAAVVTNITVVTIKASSATTVSSSLTVDPAATVTWSGGPGPAIPITNQCFAGDFNGDKETDLACYTGGSGSWNVALSTGSGWQSEFWNGGPGPALPVTDQCLTGDFNGDGKTDLACYTGNSGSWNVALSTGSGWQSEFWNGGPLLADEWSVVPVNGQCFAADFNGDGKTDLACSDGVDSVWSVSLSTGSGWTTESWSGGPVVPLPMTQQCLSGDFNGDGKADLACWTGEGGVWPWRYPPVVRGTLRYGAEARLRWTNGMWCRFPVSVLPVISMTMASPIWLAIQEVTEIGTSRFLLGAAGSGNPV